MKVCYVTIKAAHEELSGWSDDLSKWLSFNDFINMVSQSEFLSVTIEVFNDVVIPDYEITLKKV